MAAQSPRLQERLLQQKDYDMLTRITARAQVNGLSHKDNIKDYNTKISAHAQGLQRGLQHGAIS